jgi:hypothetical protein
MLITVHARSYRRRFPPEASPPKDDGHYRGLIPQACSYCCRIDLCLVPAPPARLVRSSACSPLVCSSPVCLSGLCLSLPVSPSNILHQAFGWAWPAWKLGGARTWLAQFGSLTLSPPLVQSPSDLRPKPTRSGFLRFHSPASTRIHAHPHYEHARSSTPFRVSNFQIDIPPSDDGAAGSLAYTSIVAICRRIRKPYNSQR